MFSHVMLGSNDLGRSKTFYDATLGALGAKEGQWDPKGRLFYSHNNAAFLITKPIDGQSAGCANGSTIGFAVDGPEQGEAWHKAGIEAGGTAIEDPPGYREGATGKLFLAYLRDPDGNKLCALHRPAG